MELNKWKIKNQETDSYGRDKRPTTEKNLLSAIVWRTTVRDDARRRTNSQDSPTQTKTTITKLKTKTKTAFSVSKGQRLESAFLICILLAGIVVKVDLASSRRWAQLLQMTWTTRRRQTSRRRKTRSRRLEVEGPSARKNWKMNWRLLRSAMTRIGLWTPVHGQGQSLI